MTCYPRMTGWRTVDNAAQTMIHIVWANGKYFFFSFTSIILICLFGSFLVSTTTILYLQTMGWRMVYIYIWDDKGQTTIHVIWPMVIFLFFLFLLYLFARSSLVSTTTTHHPRMMRQWWRDDEQWAIGKFFPFFFRSYYINILSWMIFRFLQLQCSVPCPCHRHSKHRR